MGKNIVIVGAGYSGILTAKKLAKKFKKDQEISITIIDKNPFHTMLTELHEVAANRVDEDSIKISLKKVFTGRKVQVKLDTVTSIDFDTKQVLGTAETYSYDYLVLCAGSKPTYFGTEGAEEYSFKLWSYDDAVLLKDHIHNMFRKAVRETNEEERKKMLTFYIVGAGFTGAEMAGELAEYAPILCENFEIDRKDVTICNVDVLSRTISNLPEKLSDKVERRMEKMGIRVMLNTSVVKLGKDYVETKNNDVITREGTYTVIWTAGIESADITAASAKKLQSGGRGRIATDAYLRSLDNENVYVIGDNMLYTPEGEERPVPQVVENCEHSADIAAHNIVCAITEQGQMEKYKPSFHGFMVCIGGRYGVARVGLPNTMFNLPSWLAMFSKHFINIIYFIQVLGWNKVFSYMRHEFFTIRNRRSFVGGHFSNRTPSFLLVPVRVWLGAVWLFEGVMKIVEGWLTEPKLTGFFGGAQSWYDSILNSDGGSTDGTSSAMGAAAESAAQTVQVAADAVSSVKGTIAETTAQAIKTASDAVSSATGGAGAATDGAAAEQAGNAAAHVGTVIFNVDFLGLFQAIFVSGKELAHSTLSDLAFKVDVPVMNWFVDHFILSSDTMQVVMQVFIVIAEILIGLALIGGLFTFPASAFSLVLQFMFVTTTGLYLGTFWMIFAAIAVLIGGGRTFGLDYYAMPALKKAWKKVPWAKKSYLYND
ncbi:NAD(P)/FAD-dependent oxidoreductase [Clostridium aminobutyricum]|uniref:NADH:ubiquinone reductase (non-electrogenic) n=1 Tax=Clostridium aminobutyricum TaxID=33953 RepID=A0A939DAZ4_CLOAM|nr:NAD(P)/FAD-dependent oxidoreductase [Clostridium aminobutyricum]MBN7774609.1 NAD(P)/FAD-dependent oxidoreductase [Clostridium aminobutyricum]